MSVSKNFPGIHLVLISIACFAFLAQSQSVNCGKIGVTQTIKSFANATSIASCAVFSGSIEIAETAAGVINLNGIQGIIGNLNVTNHGLLVSLGSNSLRLIGGMFTLSNVTVLSLLSFPLLNSVDTIYFLNLPALSTLDFSAGVSSVAYVYIIGTYLMTLDGINMKNADYIYINGNNRLKSVSLQIETAKLSIIVISNGNQLALSLPRLTSAGSIILRNVSSVDLPSLTLLSGQMVIQGTYLTNITADKVSTIAQNLSIYDNSKLNLISFPELLSVDTLNMGNNTSLFSATFEKLSRARSISLSGKFITVNLPALTYVNSSFSLNATIVNFNCSAFDAYAVKSVLPANYTCVGKQLAISSNSASTSTVTLYPTSSPSTPPANKAKDPSLSTGAEVGIIVASVVVGIAIVAGFVFCFRRRNSKSMATESTVIEKPELSAQEVPRRELPASRPLQELYQQHGINEMDQNKLDQEFEMPGESEQLLKGIENKASPR